MKKITEYLATHGIGDDYYPHTENQLLTGQVIDGWTVLDCRDMLDGSGNPLSLYKSKIEQGLEFIKKGSRIVVCCGAGVSRSNAIAAGILMFLEHSYQDALDVIHEMVKIDLIDIAHLNALRRLVYDL